MGMKITKIHRIVRYRQSKWLKPYIDFNTEKRRLATNDFEKDLFKLMNNAVFGKTLQNPRKQRQVTFVHTHEKAKRLVAHPLYTGYQALNDNLYAVERSPSSIMFDKPIYAGFAILELSKLRMYDFHYNFVKKLYPGDMSKLCFTDTDSFLYLLKTKDIYRDMMLKHHDLFDFSNFNDNHPCFEGMTADEVHTIKEKNKKVLGRFKDELGGIPLREFVGLASKMYGFTFDEGEVKKLRGIISAIVQRYLSFMQYKETLFEQKQMVTSMNVIRSKGHHLTTVKQTKISLSCFDDKRFIDEDGVTTYAHGYCGKKKLKRK